jgi:hypothetical protein
MGDHHQEGGVSILTYRSSDGRCLSSPAFQRAQGMCNSLEQLALSRSLWLVLLHIAFVESVAVFGQASCLATVKKSDGENEKNYEGTVCWTK